MDTLMETVQFFDQFQRRFLLLGRCNHFFQTVLNIKRFAVKACGHFIQTFCHIFDLIVLSQMNDFGEVPIADKFKLLFESKHGTGYLMGDK